MSFERFEKRKWSSALKNRRCSRLFVRQYLMILKNRIKITLILSFMIYISITTCSDGRKPSKSVNTRNYLVIGKPICSQGKKLCTNINTKHDLVVGKTIYFDKDYDIHNHKYWLIVSSSQISPCFDILVENIEYSIGYNEKNNSITNISTSDFSFYTPEGYKIGDFFYTFSDSLKSELICDRGWGYFIKLPSGWNATFTQGSSMTDGKLKGRAKVKFFFKD